MFDCVNTKLQQLIAVHSAVKMLRRCTISSMVVKKTQELWCWVERLFKLPKKLSWVQVDFLSADLNPSHPTNSIVLFTKSYMSNIV